MREDGPRLGRRTPSRDIVLVLIDQATVRARRGGRGGELVRPRRRRGLVREPSQDYNRGWAERENAVWPGPKIAPNIIVPPKVTAMTRHSSIYRAPSRFLCLALLAVLLHAPLGQSGEPLEGVEFIPLHQDNSAWATTLADGRLMLWWVKGKSSEEVEAEELRTAEVAYARYSSDNGYTWSPPERLFEFPQSEGKYFGSSILCDRDGVIHLFGIHFFGFNIKGNETAEELKTIVPGKSPAYHVMSSDGGKSWTPPRYCDFGHEYTGSSNCALQLSNGRILLPLSYLSRRLSGRFVTVVAYSDDGGKTWVPSRGECIVDSGSRNIESGAIEPVCLELADGRVWMLIRTKTGYLFESFSPDAGDTWSKPVPSRFRSTNAPGSLLRLRDGRIVMVWNNTHHQLSREVLAAAISVDDGETWSGYREIVRVNNAKDKEARHYAFGAVTYPYLTEAEDGAVVVAYWPQSRAVPTVARVQPDWLTQTTFRDDYSAGLDHWCTLDSEGVAVVDHAKRATGIFTPDAPKVLALRKPVEAVAAAASLNFPFGVQGHLATRIRLEPGFQGARLCLTDFFSLPSQVENGRFGISIGSDGLVSISKGKDQFTPTTLKLETGKSYALRLAWDCAKRQCELTVDYDHVAELPCLPSTVTAVTGVYQGDKSGESRYSEGVYPAGLCYLRLWSTAEGTDPEGLKLDAVSVSVKP